MGIESLHSCWLFLKKSVYVSTYGSEFLQVDMYQKVYLYLLTCFRSFEFFEILGSWDMDGSSYPCC